MQEYKKNALQTSQETTVNIRRDLLENLTNTADLLSTSRTKIIGYCLRRLVKEKPLPEKFFNVTSFQPATKNYKTFHITLNSTEYELYYDLRKTLKHSFSFIVRIALLLYMDELFSDCTIVKEDGDISTSYDEYRLSSYKISISEQEKQRFITFQWEEG